MIWRIMISKSLQGKIRHYVRILQKYSDRSWYAPFLGLLAALDNLIVVIPNDGLLISSSMIIPKRWFSLALCVALGSTVGAIVLATLIEYQGLPWVLEIYPGIQQTKTWALSMEFFERYGLLLVFVVAVTPFVQQPAVILASIAKTPIPELAAVIFVGRFIKFLIMAYIASHTPRLIKKLWGVKDELQEVGIDP